MLPNRVDVQIKSEHCCDGPYKLKGAVCKQRSRREPFGHLCPSRAFHPEKADEQLRIEKKLSSLSSWIVPGCCNVPLLQSCTPASVWASFTQGKQTKSRSCRWKGGQDQSVQPLGLPARSKHRPWRWRKRCGASREQRREKGMQGEGCEFLESKLRRGQGSRGDKLRP